jgi:hypothetical protein
MAIYSKNCSTALNVSFNARSASVVKDLFKILRSDHRPFVLTVQQEVFQPKQFACCFFPVVFDDVINTVPL